MREESNFWDKINKYVKNLLLKHVETDTPPNHLDSSFFFFLFFPPYLSKVTGTAHVNSSFQPDLLKAVLAVRDLMRGGGVCTRLGCAGQLSVHVCSAPCCRWMTGNSRISALCPVRYHRSPLSVRLAQRWSFLGCVHCSYFWWLSLFVLCSSVLCNHVR